MAACIVLTPEGTGIGSISPSHLECQGRHT
jgi:hypothetical protein